MESYFEFRTSNYYLTEDWGPQLAAIWKERGWLSGGVWLIDERVHTLQRAWIERYVEPLILGKIIIPSGESSKEFSHLEGLYERLSELRLERATPLVALGGGVVGDLTGFLAATYMRGVPLVSLPTTLLAVADASIGGKNGVDFRGAKNMIGAFYPPQLTLAGIQLLESLPPEEWACGMAEVIKTLLLCPEERWRQFSEYCRRQLGMGLVAQEEPLSFKERVARLKGDRSELLELLEGVVQRKLEIVAQDPRDLSGVRAQLNLGHTWAHALEKASNYQLRHGQAVAIGLRAAVILAQKLELAQTAMETALVEMLEFWGLPTTIPSWLKWENFARNLRYDKKCKGGESLFILPVTWGRTAKVELVPVEVLEQVWAELADTEG